MKRGTYLGFCCLLALVIAVFWFATPVNSPKMPPIDKSEHHFSSQQSANVATGSGSSDDITHQVSDALRPTERQDMATAQDTAISNEKADSNCVTYTKEQIAFYNEIIVGEYHTEIINGLTIEPYLFDLGEDALVLEYKAGNMGAAYVLGANYQHRAHYSTWSNPYLGTEYRGQVGHRTPYNAEYMEVAREWFWAAAAGDASYALLELGTTYWIERKLLIEDYESGKTTLPEEEYTLRIKTLKAKELSFGMLFDEVANDVSRFYFYDIESTAKKHSSLELEDKQRIYDEIKSRWARQRIQLGKPEQINFEIPPEMEHAIKMLDLMCLN